MQAKVFEENKKSGISYVFTEDGIELPVVDVTHPAFALELSETELERKTEEYLKEEAARGRIPTFLRPLFLRMVGRRSVIIRGLVKASGTFLSGMNTYLLKLGADNLGRGYATELDHRIAATLSGLAVRLRVQDMAWLLAENVAGSLKSRPGAPLYLLNIAGGPAIDSLNALIVLRRHHPGLLAGRKIFIHVLDLHPEAPAFGARALAALSVAGAPLAGLEATFETIAYDWRRTEPLRALLARLRLSEGVVAVSSEGGLFEYGSDEEIVANLAVLGADLPVGTACVGSVTRADGPGRRFHRATNIPLQPRTVEQFRALAVRSGWTLGEVRTRPFSYNVALLNARSEKMK